MVEQDPRPFVWIDDDIDLLRDEALSPREFSPRTGCSSAKLAAETLYFSWPSTSS